MRHGLIIEHIRATFDPGLFYSIPEGCLHVERLSDYLDDAETLAARRKRLAAHCDDLQPDMEPTGSEQPAEPNNTLLWFRVRQGNPSDKKLLRPAVGAGRSFRESHIAVTLHRPLLGLADVPVIAIEAVKWSLGAPADAMALISEISDVDLLQAELHVWMVAPGLIYTVRDMLPDGLPSARLAAASYVITSLLEAGAFPGSSRSINADDLVQRDLGFDFGENDELFLDSLRQCGIVQKVAEGGWQMLQSGLRRLQYGRALFEPSPVCQVRAGVPLSQQTSLELFLGLKNAGWTWREWLAPSRRPQSYVAVDEYRPGDRRVFFSTGTISSAYLLVLHSAEDHSLNLNSI